MRLLCAAEREVMVEQREFDDFYAASYRRLVGQVYAMIGDVDEAEECVQEAFARAWAHRRRLQTAEHPEAWVRTTAYRLAVSRWRRVRLGRRSPDRALQASGVVAPPDENTVALASALRRLPEAQRRAVVLHHLADLPIEAIATELGVPVGTIKARLSRGRTALASLLADASSPPSTPPSTAEARHA